MPSCDVDDKPTTVTERREGTRRPLSRPTALRPAGPEDVDLSPCKSDLTAARRTHAPSLSVDFAPPSSVDFACPDPRVPLLPTVARATTQPTLLLPRCNSASPVDTALSKFVRRRNQHCCPSVATEHRVLQQRSAGLCDDATNAAANPLQRRLLHQILLQQRSVRLRTAATRRNPLQQRIACCNSAHYHNTARCTTAQSDATEHRVLQQSTIPSLHSATRRRSCCGSAVQRCSLFCNSVAQQRNRFQCRAVSCSRPRPAVADHSPLQPAVAIATQRSSMFTVCHKTAAQPVATQRHRLQPSTVRCNRPHFVVTCCSDCNAAQTTWSQRVPQTATQPVATQRNLLQRCAVRCNRPHSVETCCSDCNAAQTTWSRCATAQKHNRLQRSAPSRNAVPSVATDLTPLKPVAAVATQRRQHGHSVCHKQQHNRLQRSATCCNAVPSVATDHTPLKPVAAIATHTRWQPAVRIATQSAAWCSHSTGARPIPVQMTTAAVRADLVALHRRQCAVPAPSWRRPVFGFSART